MRIRPFNKLILVLTLFWNQVDAASIAAPTLNSQDRWTNFRQAFVRGGVARSFGQAVLYPVDALRTLAQTRDGKTLSDVGTKALVRGCFTTSSFALAMGALQFSIFNSLKESVGAPLAAACGATASCLVSVPQEVIKQNLVAGVYPSFRSAVRSIATEKGLKGFYKAWGPTMSRNIPFVMITFTFQDILKDFITFKTKKSELGIQENMLAGMTSALVAGAITNPIDVIKTRMMTQAASTAVPYKSALDCFSTVLQKEGVATFYSGFRQRSIYMCGLWGLTFAINGRLSKKKES
jgi:solute carrier family 25 S-adenosylmethionine transporter 26